MVNLPLASLVGVFTNAEIAVDEVVFEGAWSPPLFPVLTFLVLRARFLVIQPVTSLDLKFLNLLATAERKTFFFSSLFSI